MEKRAVPGQRPAFLIAVYCVAGSRDDAMTQWPLDRVTSRGDNLIPPP
jgi:hypothetical protein